MKQFGSLTSIQPNRTRFLSKGDTSFKTEKLKTISFSPQEQTPYKSASKNPKYFAQLQKLLFFQMLKIMIFSVAEEKTISQGCFRVRLLGDVFSACTIQAGGNNPTKRAHTGTKEIRDVASLDGNPWAVQVPSLPPQPGEGFQCSSGVTQQFLFSLFGKSCCQLLPRLIRLPLPGTPQIQIHPLAAMQPYFKDH